MNNTDSMNPGSLVVMCRVEGSTAVTEGRSPLVSLLTELPAASRQVVRQPREGRVEIHCARVGVHGRTRVLLLRGKYYHRGTQ